MKTINETGWLTFTYSDKSRMGYALGPDTRPGTNNLVVLTPDGTRTFNVSKMLNVVNESELYVIVPEALESEVLPPL